MEQQDIRWKQRFQNFDKAFLRLSKAMQIIREEPDNFLRQAFQSANNIQTSYFPLLKALHTWLEIQAHD